MTDESKRKRASIAARLTFRIAAAAALMTIISDIVLCVAPNASLAAWYAWRFLVLSRGQWYGLWSISFLLVIVAFLVQLCVDSRVRRWFSAKTLEIPWKDLWNFAPVFAVWLVGVSLDLLRDYAPLTDRIEAHWADVYPKPPARDPEDLSLRELADLLDIEPDRAADALRREGFPVNRMSRRVDEIARMRHARPIDVYNALRAISPRRPPAATPSTPR